MVLTCRNDAVRAGDSRMSAADGSGGRIPQSTRSTSKPAALAQPFGDHVRIGFEDDSQVRALGLVIDLPQELGVDKVEALGDCYRGSGDHQGLLFAGGVVGEFAGDVQVADVPGVLLQNMEQDPGQRRPLVVRAEAAA
jgi:hypothetical protein